MNKPTSIALGLDAIFSIEKTTHKADHADERIELINLESIIPSPYQARKNFTESELQELANSIRELGIIQPIIIRANGDVYELIAGERRLRASRLVGLTKIPAIICKVDNRTAMAFGLVENIQRKNLNSVDEALAFARLRDEFLMTHEEIATLVGKSRVSITNSLRLLSLDPLVLDLIKENKIDMGHARALLNLSPDEQCQMAEKITEQRLNVREVESQTGIIKQNYNSGDDQCVSRYIQECAAMSLELTDKLGAKSLVRLNGKGAGKITIEVSSLDEARCLIEKLVN